MSENKCIISVCYRMGDLPSRTAPYSEAFAEVDIICGCYRWEAKMLFPQRCMYPWYPAVSLSLPLCVAERSLRTQLRLVSPAGRDIFCLIVTRPRGENLDQSGKLEKHAGENCAIGRNSYLRSDINAVIPPYR